MLLQMIRFHYFYVGIRFHYIAIPCFIYSSINGCLGRPLILAIVNQSSNKFGSAGTLKEWLISFPLESCPVVGLLDFTIVLFLAGLFF